MTPAPPEPLADHHRLDAFDCGAALFNDWLQRRARANQLAGASRVYVVAHGGDVMAYYALASGSIAATDTAGFFRRNMPDPIPVAILGRLAVDKRFQGQGFGRGLMRDAGKRVLAAADAIGIRGLIVNAISEDAKAFYLALGFRESPLHPMTLMIALQAMRSSL